VASQSIRFDFLSTGAARLAADFRNTGDSASSAARGAAVLQKVIESLGQKENRTAAESEALARALRLTGDAEDRAAAKALAADIAIRRLNDAMAASSKSTDSARGGFAKLAGEVTGFGAASDAASSGGNKFKLALAGINLASGVLEPVMAGVVVAAGGLASGLAAAGAGIGAFGLVAKSVFAEASKAATAYAAAQARFSTATTSAQRVSALKAEQAAFAGLSPPVKALAIELGNTQKMWKAFTDAAAPGVVGVLSQGIGILTSHFGILSKFLPPVEAALRGILARVNTGLNSAGFKSFTDMLAQNTGPAITKIAIAIGNVIVGIGGILKAFMPTSQQMLSGIDKITAKFREWGTTLSGGTGFKSLMQTFRTETPQAMAILTNLGAVIANVGKAMFGLSSFSNSRLLLNLLTPLSGVMASLSKNTDLVRIAMYALLAVKIGQQFSWVTDAWKGIVKFAAATEGATIAQTIAAAATKAWGLAMDALPWVALAAAVVAVALLVIKYHKQIWDFAQKVWHDILAVIMATWNWVKANWPLLLGIITGPIGLAILWVVQNFGKITTAVKTVLSAVKTAWDVAWGAIKTAFGVFIADGVVTPFGKITAAVKTVLTAVQTAWNTVWGAIKTAFGVFISAGVIAPFNTITGAVRTVLSAVSSAWNSVWNTLKAAFRVFVVDGILAPLGLIITGAAKAFGWVPGLGGKLQAAATAFTNFKNSVNAALGGINGRTVHVNVAMATAAGPAPHGAATGMYVTQGTGPTADDVLIRVSRGELVVPTRLVRAGAVDHLRGKIPGFASGGPVGVNVAAAVPSIAQVESTLMASVMKLAVVFAKAAQAAAAAASVPGGGGPTSASASQAQAYASGRLGAYGWGAAQMKPLILLWNQESGWNRLARNPSSGAYGIPQALPASKMGAAANPPTSSAGAQIDWGLNYIKGRYGSPAGAWAHEVANNWYASGTASALPGWAWVGERGPEMVRFRGGEQVIPAHATGGGGDGWAALVAELRALRGQMAELNRTTAAIPAATGRHVGGAIGGAASSASFRSRYPRGGA
jgi:hypothetical protein